ncbi:hypothetical protein GGE33_004512 [Rhizobium cellulosilyticum]|uniref:Uncharacterized protein n=1 Tax=Aliirhizobium cellulosilyticum TaxID=393664 RepID=A0A7W6SBJ5_9HYPH|nr:hypothetical protein [Rhizobium cellulosilyticum]
MLNQTRNILLSTILTMTLAGTAEAQSARPSRYADGVYAATGEYGGQPSHITVTATLNEGVIAAVTVTPHAYVPMSLVPSNSNVPSRPPCRGWWSANASIRSGSENWRVPAARQKDSTMPFFRSSSGPNEDERGPKTRRYRPYAKRLGYI